MSALVKRRERIARVRRIEHVLAAGGVAAAETQLAHLESSESRLTDLRCSLSTMTGSFAAETLAARAELALRLDEARFGLIDAITAARATVELRRGERIEARLRQESADRLGERAAQAVAKTAERRAGAEVRTRSPRGLGAD